MDEISNLAERHIRESESHLRHIDEMMARANQSRSTVLVAPDIELSLVQIRRQRDQLEQELADIRRQPAGDWSGVAKRSEGLKGVLQTVGGQLEKILAVILAHDIR